MWVGRTKDGSKDRIEIYEAGFGAVSRAWLIRDWHVTSAHRLNIHAWTPEEPDAKPQPPFVPREVR